MASCPYCKKYFDKKSKAVEHIEKAHPDQLNGMTPEQALYYSTHGTINGICMCGCGKPTEWNYKTGKPFKLSPDPNCKARAYQKANANYVRTHGETRGQTLRTDMNVQKEMQANRPSAGKYRFKDGGAISYLSKLELNFLRFCDTIMEFPSRMILDCPFTYHYHDDSYGGDRTYMPDYWMPDYNLLIEIKEGGKHPNTNPAYIKETKYKEKLKDELMKNQTEHNFIKIVDANYGPFMEILFKIVEGDRNPGPAKKNALIVIPEAAIDFDEIPTVQEPHFSGMHLVVSRDPLIGTVNHIGVAESALIAKIYLADDNMIRETTLMDDAFDYENVSIYEYVGNKDLSETALRAILRESNIELNGQSAMVRLTDILTECGIQYQLDRTMKNNDHREMDFVKIGEMTARRRDDDGVPTE